MEGKETALPASSESVTHQEDDSSRKDSEYDDSEYQGILPSMPSRDIESPYAFRAAPQASTPPTSYAQMPSFAQPAGYMNMPPMASFAQPDPRGLGAGGIIPSNTSPLGHAAYSASAQGTGGYTHLPPLSDTSAAGLPPVQSYPGYGQYNQSPGYGYGSSGQGFPYGTGAHMQYSSLGAPGSRTGYPGSYVPTGDNYQGMGTDMMYGGSAQAYQFDGSGYPQHYQGQTGHGSYAAPVRGQEHQQGALPARNRSHAKKPGRPYFRDKNRSGPDGANLFVFHIPNDMTNADLLGLFKPHGNVQSVRIMTEEDTGRGRGFGFVSYDSADSAARAIHYLNGYQIQGKRLKVQHKQVNKSEIQGQELHRHPSPTGFMPVQQLAMPVQQLARPSSAPHQLEPQHDISPTGFVPVQEYLGEPEPERVTTPVLPEPEQRRETTPVLPEPEQRRETTPVLPDPEQCRATTPVLPEPEQRCETTPVLLPVEYQGAQESYQGAQENTTSLSPLADLKDIREALPDLHDD